MEARELDEVLQKCLAKDRVERFATVLELQQELMPAIHAYAKKVGKLDHNCS